MYNKSRKLIVLFSKRMQLVFFALLVLGTLLCTGCSNSDQEAPRPTATPTALPTATPTAVPTATPIPGAAVINGNFSIRNGITYKMPRADVIAIEDSNVTSTKRENGSVLHYSNYGYSTSLLGHEACLVYEFDSQGCLDELQYELYAANAYTSVVDALCEKYGQPRYTSSPIFGTEIFAAKETFNRQMSNPTATSILEYKGWLIQYDDCVVVVEVCKLYFKQLGTLYYVNYCPFSYEEVETILLKNQNSIDNNL